MLIPPHGGDLVDLRLSSKERERVIEDSRNYPRLTLDRQEIDDIEMLATGVYSPLRGFMGQSDFFSVLKEMRLADGTVWPLPVTLRASQEEVDRIGTSDWIVLEDTTGTTLAVMELEERFLAERNFTAKAVYGTDDPNHPGVRTLLKEGEVCLGGTLRVVTLPLRKRFLPYRLEPTETRREFEKRGWKQVVGFQTRNPLHHAHEYIQKCALEEVDGLILQPVVDDPKPDDVPPDVRIKTYETIFEYYYPPEHSMISIFPEFMRYAGPKEAVLHALCRKNYGCSHFIVGRDHAGVGHYYGRYDAQQIFTRFEPSEISIIPIFFEEAFYCRRCGNMATTKTCPHKSEEHIIYSGTQIRRMLREGQAPPEEFTRPEVADILIKAYRERADLTKP